MEQLRAMSQLQDLAFRFNTLRVCGISPFPQLAVAVDDGLEQLISLSRLKVLTVSGLMQCIVNKEMKWMAQYWPRLLSIELLIHSRVGPNDKRQNYCRLIITWYIR